ncbi:sulfatase [Lacibacter sp.]|uniref:sulfatase n=1 Tax=Lacibacter sp. TaxID=1915409 RepID=UPI002B4ABE73|nr:sulfatase [Lacibacter sp.]HLP36022.1 sulfatase [Lacibacter sp.]
MYRNFIVLLPLLFVQYTLGAQSKGKQPNVIVILADDLGWADLSSYGSTFYETPNLDKLASNGIRFTQNYATCPVCSPTRASMMTGKYAVKTGVTDWIKGRQEDGKAMPYEKLIAQPTAYQLALQEKTIAEYALENNYKTFFAGKWHLGEEEKYWPQYQGFQTNIGGWSKGSPTGRINDTTGGFFTPYKNPTLPDGPTGEYLTDRLSNECLSFIERNQQTPFFLMYSLYAVHNPLQAPAALIKKYQAKQKELGIQNKDRFAKDEDWMKYENGWRRRLVQDNPVYAAMIENMDWNIGRMLEKLKQLNLDDNTLVIFTSDNGGLSTAEGSPTTNGPLRAGKGWLYEGGIRVPLIMYWKGKIIAGSTSDLPVTTADLFPTIAKAINEKYRKEKSIDGENILQLLNKPQAYQNRKLYWHYPHYSNQGGKPGSAIREGNYKLIYNYEDESVELYDVVNDIAEKKNIASANQKLVNQLRKKLQKWQRETNALTPYKNPGYNPSVVVSPTTGHQ